MSRVRILLADHHAEDRAAVSRALRLKYEVIEAIDGLETIEMLDDLEPDLAVLVPNLPRRSGYDVAQAIRRHSRLRAIPIIFLCTDTTETCARKAYASGANLFLAKPIDPDRLIKNIVLTIEHEEIEPAPKKYGAEELKRMERQRLLDEMRRHKAEAVAKAQEQARPRPPAPEPEKPRAGARPAAPPPPAREPSGPPRAEPGGSRRKPAARRTAREGRRPSVIPPPDARPRARRAKGRDNGDGRSDSAAPQVDTEGGIPRVMIVEDDDDTRQLMDITLRKQFEVTTARNGIEALQNIPDYEPDMLILDIMLPKLNGCQLLQKLKGMPRYHKLPIVVVTAKASDRDRRYVESLGATDFIPKPFDPDDLFDTIVAMTRLPGFKVGPKRATITEIIEREYLRAKDKMDTEGMRDRQLKFAELQELLKTNRPGKRR